uniref:RING-type domain-containing protein n=1 Tax=Daucus carota subsp. sativus TaxID=79200 RepID=A0A166JFY5_DAUCS
MAESSEPPRQPESVCTFFKKPTKNRNIRKRNLSEDDGVEEDEGSKSDTVTVNRKKSSLQDNKLHFSTAPTKQLKSSDVETKKEQTLFQFESSSAIQVQNDSRATATPETKTDFSRDARAICERVLKQAEAALKGKNKGEGDDKLYKGINAYTDHKAGFRREQTVAGEKAGGSHGPLRASAHIRVSARLQVTKSGWQLEKEWDEKEKARKRNLALKQFESDEEAEQSDEDDDSLPFACFICRQPFADPVVTKCKHYFCEHCTLKVFEYIFLKYYSLKRCRSLGP